MHPSKRRFTSAPAEALRAFEQAVASRCTAFGIYNAYASARVIDRDACEIAREEWLVQVGVVRGLRWGLILFGYTGGQLDELEDSFDRDRHSVPVWATSDKALGQRGRS